MACGDTGVFQARLIHNVHHRFRVVLYPVLPGGNIRVIMPGHVYGIAGEMLSECVDDLFPYERAQLYVV